MCKSPASIKRLYKVSSMGGNSKGRILTTAQLHTSGYLAPTQGMTGWLALERVNIDCTIDIYFWTL